MLSRKDHLHRFVALDLLRGIACFAVVMLHTGHLLNFSLHLPHAHLAVDFFFILSGFVIAHAYEKKLEANMTFVDFAKVRLVRLYPMIFLGVLIGASVLSVRMMTTDFPTMHQLLVVTLCALVLLPTTALNPTRDELYPVNGPHWSLFYELVINLVYASISRWLHIVTLILVCLLSGIALYAIAVHSGGINGGGLPNNFFYGFVRVTFPFTLGVLAFRFRKQSRFDPWPSVSYFGIISVGIGLSYVLLSDVFQANGFYEFFIDAFVFPLFVLFGSHCKVSGIYRAVCIEIGELSYPVYATHEPFLRVIENLIRVMHLHMSQLVQTTVSLVVTITAASLFLYLYDKPIRSYLRDRFISSPSHAKDGAL